MNNDDISKYLARIADALERIASPHDYRYVPNCVSSPRGERIDEQEQVRNLPPKRTAPDDF